MGDAGSVDGQEKLISWLLTEKDFSDFKLQFECRMGPRTNSGIALRTLSREKPTERLQIQLWGEEPKAKHLETGTIQGLPVDANDANTRPKTAAPLRPLGSWNIVEIEFQGPHLKVTINGQLVQDVRVDKKGLLPNACPDVLRTSGRIGLQSETGKIEFRHLEVHELDSSPQK